ncbi:MAG: phosphonoacetaldehyde hydrolase [Bryobacteraceae bacterium]
MKALSLPGVRAVVFDISGTVLDFGSRGPVRAFVELFTRNGVTITEAEARKPMGAHKRDHIQAILADPSVAVRWRETHGSWPDAGTLASLYNQFTPLQIEVLERHVDVLPGVADVADELHRRGIPIAATTGFDSSMIVNLKAAAAAQGYAPDVWVTPDLVGAGRPAPWMIFHAARKLGVYPLRHVVKVGDTAADIAEAHNAGTWAVSVVRTGNEIGLSQEELDALPDDEREARFRAAREKFTGMGAHYVIDSVAALLPVIDEISARIERGERP